MTETYLTMDQMRDLRKAGFVVHYYGYHKGWYWCHIYNTNKKGAII